MYGQQVSKPTAAYYLTLIGGILGIIAGVFFILIFFIGIWIIIANALMVMYAQRMMAQPMEHSKYGTYIIVLSILGGLNILALIGGILAAVHNSTPIQPAMQPPYRPYGIFSQPAGYCPQCGSPLPTGAQFCTHCGNPLTSQ